MNNRVILYQMEVLSHCLLSFGELSEFLEEPLTLEEMLYSLSFLKKPDYKNLISKNSVKVDSSILRDILLYKRGRTILENGDFLYLIYDDSALLNKGA